MENNNSIFVQAKIEYTKQLVNTLKPQMYDGIKSIYDDAKEIYKSNSSTSLLFIFRTLLEKIPAYKRMGIEINNQKTQNEDIFSKTILNEDNQLEFPDVNTYLHDNVD